MIQKTGVLLLNLTSGGLLNYELISVYYTSRLKSATRTCPASRIESWYLDVEREGGFLLSIESSNLVDHLTQSGVNKGYTLRDW